MTPRLSPHTGKGQGKEVVTPIVTTPPYLCYNQRRSTPTYMSTPQTVPAAQVIATLRKAVCTPSYQPSEEQRSLKAQFWIAFKANPLCDVDDITPALVNQLTGVDVQKWLSDDRYWPWMATRDSVKLSLEIAAEKAAEMAIAYLDPSVPMNDNARVQLIKYVLEFSGRSPATRREEKWMDKEVGQLNEEQLDALIAKLTAKRLPEG